MQGSFRVSATSRYEYFRVLAERYRNESSKNDNARAEQKNWTHVRQLFGYDRIDDQRAFVSVEKKLRVI